MAAYSSGSGLALALARHGTSSTRGLGRRRACTQSSCTTDGRRTVRRTGTTTRPTDPDRLTDFTPTCRGITQRLSNTGASSIATG